MNQGLFNNNGIGYVIGAVDQAGQGVTAGGEFEFHEGVDGVCG